MMFGLLVSLYLSAATLQSNDFSHFSSHKTCPTLELDSYITHPMFQNIYINNEVILYYPAHLKEDPTLEFSRQKPRDSNYSIEYSTNFSLSLFFFAGYSNVKDFVSQQVGSQYWPKQVRLIYAGERINDLPGIGALFCRDYQTPNMMTLVVTTNFLKNPTTFARILAHEVYHYILQIKNVNLPHWLEEGLATQFEDKSNFMGGVISSPMMDYHSKKRPWASLSQLGNEDGFTREDVYAFYGHANLLIYYIEKNISKNLTSLFVTETYKSWESFLTQLLQPKWESMKEMFIDFQIAKYINKTDDYNISTDNTEDLLKYTVLPPELKTYLVQANRSPIDFTPPPLSGFVPQSERLPMYENQPDYTVKWILIEKYGAILVTDEFLHAGSFPLVIRWK
jgi:hypothetical protein